METSFVSLVYLFFRLAPFILVCFFVLGSIISSEAKGFVYLVGLIVSLAMTYGIFQFFTGPLFAPPLNPNPEICNYFKVEGVAITQFSISIAIFSYTFFYLLYPIIKYKLAQDNILLLIFFPTLILGEFIWNRQMKCFNSWLWIGTLVVTGGFGALWAYCVDQTKLKGLQYYNIGSNREMCSAATQVKYKCTSKKITK